MSIALIGIIKDINKNTIGFRLLDLNSKAIKDVDYNSVVQVLSSGKLKINGLELKNKKLVGSCGSLDRYPTIVNGVLVGNSPLIITTQYILDDVTSGYSISDWKGLMLIASVAETIRYAKINGIANGAIKSINDKEFISPISGEYPKTVSKSKKENLEDFEKTIWNMDEFSEYMENNGHSFFVRPINNNINEILFRCNTLKVIKYPIGINSISADIFNVQSDLEVLIITPSLTDITYNILSRTKNLRRIVFQEGMKRLNAIGLRSTDDIEANVSELAFPNSLRRLDGGFNDFKKLTSIDLSNTEVEFCNNVFNKAENVTELKLPETLRVIENSFSNLPLKHIEIPKNIRKISAGSFSSTNIETLDLSEHRNLTELGHSVFAKCNELKEVIFNDELEVIGYNAFILCENITNIKLPKGIKEIGHSAFRGCNLKEIVVGSSLNYINGGIGIDETVLVFDESNDVIKSNSVTYPGYKKVRLPETIKVIKESAFKDNEKMEEIELPTSLTEIWNKAFYSCGNLKNLDISHATELSFIGESAFEKCERIINIVLPEGIKEIGANCFMSCTRVKRVLLPKSLEKIGRAALDLTGSSKNRREKVLNEATFYVYDKSEALKYCKRNNFNYIIIDSLDEFYYYSNENREISKSKESKIRMMLSMSNNHAELLKPKFINYADILYGIYNHINKDVQESTVLLDERKFINFPLEKIEVVNKYLINTRRNKHLQPTERLSPIFISLCNYITRLTGLDVTPFTSNSLEYIKDNVRLFNTFYLDNRSSIVTFEVKHPGRVSQRSLLLVIEIDKNIKFVSSIDRTDSLQLNCLIYDKHIDKKQRHSIADILEKGDNINVNYYEDSATSIIKGATLPRYILIDVAKNIVDDFIVIGQEDLQKIKRSGSDIFVILDLMCLVTGKIITAQCRINYKEDKFIREVNRVNQFTVLEVSDINNYSKEVEKRILRDITNEQSKKLFTKITYRDEYTSALSKAQGAFDETECYEFKVAKQLVDSRTKSLKDLQLHLIKSILDTRFFTKTNRTLKQAEDLGSVSFAYNLSDGRHSLIEFRLNKAVTSNKCFKGTNLFITALIDNDSNIDTKQKFYTSPNGINHVIGTLFNIGEGGELTEELTIDNNKYDKLWLENNHVIVQALYEKSISYRNTWMLTISKNNGGIYLLFNRQTDNNNAGDVYKILRFKDLDAAIRNCSWMNENFYENRDDYILKIKNSINILADNLVIGNSELIGDISIIRDAVIRGLPNNHHIEANFESVWNDVAKQRP